MNKYLIYKMETAIIAIILSVVIIIPFKDFLDIGFDKTPVLYIAGIVLAIIIVIIIRKIHWLLFKGRISKAAEILKADQDVNIYIVEIGNLVKKAKTKKEKNLALMNLSVGYGEKGDYETAKDILSQVPIKSQKGINKAVYLNHMANLHFVLEETEWAIEIMETYRFLFEKYQDSKVIRGSFSINKVYEYIAKKEIRNAKIALVKANDMCQDNYMRRHYDSVERKLSRLK